jgi:hypothetical protein
MATMLDKLLKSTGNLIHFINHLQRKYKNAQSKYQARLWKLTVLVLRIICVYRFSHHISCHTCHIIKNNSTILPICTASTGAKAI